MRALVGITTTLCMTAQLSASIVIDSFDSSPQSVSMGMVTFNVCEASQTSDASPLILPTTGSSNRRTTSVQYRSVNAPYNMWQNVAQARRASCIIDGVSGNAVMSMTGRLTTGTVKLDYAAGVGSAINLAAFGDAFEVDGRLLSGPVAGQTGFGSTLSIFIEVRDVAGRTGRSEIVNQTGGELSEGLSFGFSLFHGVDFSSLERVTVGLDYSGNDYFDLIYSPPEYRLNTFSVIPVPAASALLLAGGLLTRRRRN